MGTKYAVDENGNINKGVIKISDIRRIDLNYGDMFRRDFIGWAEAISSGAGGEPLPEQGFAFGYSKLSTTMDEVWNIFVRVPFGYNITQDYFKVKFTAHQQGGMGDTITIDVVAKKRTGIDAFGADLITSPPMVLAIVETEYTFDMSGQGIQAGDWILIEFSVTGHNLDWVAYDNFFAEYKGYPK